MSSVARALAAALLLALAACGDGNDALLGTLERDRLELVAEAQETILEIAVREGEPVQSGQLLLRLDPSAAAARLEQARANATQAERRHAENVAGTRREQVNQARANVVGAAARAATESKEFDRIDRLVAQQLLPASTLDRQRALRDGAAADERAARDRLEELVHGTRAEVIEQSAAALAAARARVTGLELSLERHAVRAPRDGVVDALPYKLGERPPKGAPVLVMLAGGAPHARVFIPESRRAAVGAGTAATVRFDGSDRAWRAEIRYVSSEAAFTPYYALNERERGRLAYLAEVVLTEPEAVTLPTGIPVEVTLEAGKAGP
ncbi:MAG: HlyD family efflux transporter periplasmic adaptor subunit [Gammaproteobacteria bacterium]|nr:HlyD family efflux transporter periplasmic adaptor subunit [Gammaproteobacteria bacterium]